MKKKLFLVFVILTSNILTDCCDKLDYIKYDLLLIAPLEKTKFSVKPILENDSVNVLNFGIMISFKTSFYSSFFSRLTNKLYATEPCNYGEKGFNESIVELSIKSNSDIDNNHFAGSELLDLFVYKQNYFLSYQNNSDTTYKSIDDNYYELMKYGYWQNLFLSKVSLTDSVHKFTIYVKLSDGREFTETTFPIRFTK